MEQLEIIRSKRRTIAIEVKKDLRIVVRVPLEMKDNDIQRFVMEKQRWIEKHLQIVKKRNEEKCCLEGSPTACGKVCSYCWCDSGQDHHPQSTKPVGLLLCQGQFELQLSVDALPRRSTGLCGGA